MIKLGESQPWSVIVFCNLFCTNQSLNKEERKKLLSRTKQTVATIGMISQTEEVM
jgi:hypothetical protein